MSNAIAIVQSDIQPVNIASELPAIFQLASALSRAGGFLPAHLKSEGELVAVILAGRELGIQPMASIRGIRLIQGQVALDATLQLGLMVRVGCKVRWLEDGSSGSAALELTRPGHDPHVSRFSLKDAERAGLVKSGGNWSKYPSAMLRARCVSSAGKAYCPDVLAGVYLPDELDAVGQLRQAQEHDAPDLRIETSADTATNHGFVEQERLAEKAEHVASASKVDVAAQIAALISIDLPACTKRDHFAALALQLGKLHGRVRNSRPWSAFEAACAQHEVSARDAVNDALAMLENEAAQ